MANQFAAYKSQIVALGRSIADPNEWVIASAEIRPHLDPQVAWVAEASELDPLLRCEALGDAEQLLIACHGSSDGLALGGGLSKAALKTQVSQQRQAYPLPPTTPVQLWACHAGGAEGPAAALQEALGNPVLASTTTLGRGNGLVGIKESATTKVLQDLPIALHTNSVGFDIVDNLNGTFGLVVYYGSYHVKGSPSLLREGGLALYTLDDGKNSSLFNSYTTKAYGKGGGLGKKVIPFQNPPQNTEAINIPLSHYGNSGTTYRQGGGFSDIESLGFVPGQNYYFASKDQRSLIPSNYNADKSYIAYSGNGSQYLGTFAHQSALVPAIIPGTYRSGYDCSKVNLDGTSNTSCKPIEDESEKPTDDEVGKMTADFDPASSISNALITITGSGDLIFGDAPKVLIDSIDLDNGYSPTDFITSTRTVKISGSYAETSGVKPADIKVTFNGQTYTTAKNELTAANGSWTLDFGDQQFEQKSYTVDAIVASDNSTKVSQELDIVNVSVQSIDRDDGEDPNDFITSDQSLVIEGLYDADRFEALEIGITNNSGAEIVAGRRPSSTLGDVWTLDLTDQVLTEGTYSINVTATDENGATYNNSQPLKIVDIPQPLVVTAVGGNPSLLATNNKPQISGTYDPADFANGGTIGQLTINGIGYRTNSEIQLNGSGTWTLNPNTLPYGALDIRSEIQSSQHYNTADYQITIVDENSKDATDPNPPVITQIANNEGNFVSASGPSITTQAFDLELKGTYRPEDAQVSLSVEFDGNTYKLGSDKQLTAIGNEWTFKLPNAKSGSLTVQNTNLYNRSKSTPSNITIDVPAPAAPTIETLASSNDEVEIISGQLASATNTKLVLTGGYESLRSVGGLELTYEGETYVLGEDPELTNFGDTWTFELENPTSDLAGSAVQVKATSASGKFSTADASVALTLPDPTKPELIDVDGANVTNLTLTDDFKEVDYLVDGDTLIITGSFDPDNAAGGLAVSFVGTPADGGGITDSTPATTYTLDDSELSVNPDVSNQWILTLPSQTGVLQSATAINGNGKEAIAEFGTKILELDLDAFDFSQSGNDSGSGDEDSGLAVRGTPTNNYPNQLLLNEDSNSYFLFATSSKQDNWLKGEEGNDEMLSNGGADTLQGGAGQDEFTVSEQTAAVEGGDGNDVFNHQRAAFNLHTLDMGSGRDRLVNTGMVLMAEKDGQERVLQMGAGKDQLTTNTYIDVDVLDGGDGFDKLVLTDASNMEDELVDQKDAFESHKNNTSQGFEIKGFESIRQQSGTFIYRGDFMSSKVMVDGGVAQFDVTDPVSGVRAKRFRLAQSVSEDAPTLHFDISTLLEDDLTAKETIRFTLGRLAKPKSLDLSEVLLTLKVSKGGAPMAPTEKNKGYAQWDLMDPNPPAMDTMSAEGNSMDGMDHSMASMAVEIDPDQSIYLGRKGRNLILTTADIFA